MHASSAALLALLASATSLLAQDDAWIQDFAKAKAKAAAEKKDLLIDFTGSDWCSWCKKLDGEVFSKELFLTTVQKQFVLVKLDYPRDEKLVTPEIKAQNQKLQGEYMVEGYPTIFLTDAAGRPYAQTGYEKGGAENYVEMIAGMKKKGDALQAGLAKAKTLKGAEMGKAIDAALGELDEPLVMHFYKAEVEQIVKADADGKAGLKDKFEAKLAEAAKEAENRAKMQALQAESNALQEQIQPLMEKKDFEGAIAKLEEVIKAKKSKSQEQLAHFFKGLVIMDWKQDAAAAIKELEAAKAIDGASPLASQIEMILPQLKQMLDQKKEEAGKEGEAKKEEGKKEEKKEEGKKQ